jgi:hypothetical protein
MLRIQSEPPLEVLHAHAQQGEFAPGAVVQGEESVVVYAPYPEVVRTVSNPDNWTKFDTHVTRVRAPEGLVPGGPISHRVGMITVKGIIGRVRDVPGSHARRPEYELSWAGLAGTMGIGNISRYVLHGQVDGTTLLTSYEAVYLPRLITGMGDRALQFFARPDLFLQRQQSWLNAVARLVEPAEEE